MYQRAIGSSWTTTKGSERAADACASSGFYKRRHRIFQIENDRVRARIRKLRDHTLSIGWAEQDASTNGLSGRSASMVKSPFAEASTTQPLTLRAMQIGGDGLCAEARARRAAKIAWP